MGLIFKGRLKDPTVQNEIKSLENKMKRNNALISAILTIALCVCLIAGSTYAIFTSSGEYNIAVTSGTVKLVATASDLTTYEKLTDGAPTNENSAAEADGSVLFVNKGYAKLDGKKLTISNMTPGDGVKLTVAIDGSETNVAIKYRVVLSFKGDLGPALSATVSDGSATGGINIPVDSDSVTETVEVASDWVTLNLAEIGNLSSLTVDIFFPNGDPAHDNLFQNCSCDIFVRIEAVQANADTTGL